MSLCILNGPIPTNGWNTPEIQLGILKTSPSAFQLQDITAHTVTPLLLLKPLNTHETQETPPNPSTCYTLPCFPSFHHKSLQSSLFSSSPAPDTLPCNSYGKKVPNWYGPYAYYSFDKGVACTQHIQLPIHM